MELVQCQFDSFANEFKNLEHNQLRPNDCKNFPMEVNAEKRWVRVSESTMLGLT